MSLAHEKYKLLHDELKVWMQKSKEELEFIAMQNEYRQALQQIKKNNRNGDNKKEKGDDTKGKKTEDDAKWAWKGVAPKATDPQEKEFDGKTYIHCPHHGDLQWVLKINRKGKVHTENCKAYKNAMAQNNRDGVRQAALASVAEHPDALGGTTSETTEKI